MNLPAHLQPLATFFVASGARHGVDPALLAAVCDRESRGGLALRELCGDWTARTGHWLAVPGVKVVDVLPAGWGGSGAGPWAIPTDGLGWGRGLMQLDFANAQGIDWRDPATNIEHGAWMLSVRIADFPRNLRAAVASYNCGAAAVRRALLSQRDEDTFTTGQNYGADVLRRRDSFLKEQP